MARNKSTQLTDGEQSIMEVLWKYNEASVREITDHLCKTKPTAYTTTQTLCKILVDKGYAEFRKEGKAFIYSSKICLLYTSPSPRDKRQSRMPSSA